MAKVKPGLVAFNGGEVGVRTLARSDLEGYPRTAEIMENVFLDPQGAMSKAPGTMFIAEAPEGTDVFVRPFEFSIGDNLVLVMSDESLRLVRDCDYVMLAGAAATVGAWSDQSAAPPSGGGTAPPTPGGGGGVSGGGAGGGGAGGGGGDGGYNPYDDPDLWYNLP